MILVAGFKSWNWKNLILLLTITYLIEQDIEKS